MRLTSAFLTNEIRANVAAPATRTRHAEFLNTIIVDLSTLAVGTVLHHGFQGLFSKRHDSLFQKWALTNLKILLSADIAAIVFG